MVLLFATSKKYDKVLYTPHNWLSPSLNNLSSSRDLTFLCVTDTCWNNSHEVIARSYCDETFSAKTHGTDYRREDVPCGLEVVSRWSKLIVQTLPRATRWFQVMEIPTNIAVPLYWPFWACRTVSKLKICRYKITSNQSTVLSSFQNTDAIHLAFK